MKITTILGISLLAFQLTFSSARTQGLVHFTPGYFGGALMIERPDADPENQYIKLRDALAELGYSCKKNHSYRGLDNSDYLFCFDLPKDKTTLKSRPREKNVLFLWEPPTVNATGFNKQHHGDFGKIFTWDDSLVDNKKYFKLYYPQYTIELQEPLVDFDDKKLCTMVVCNKNSRHPKELYSARRRAIKFFEKLEDKSVFDLYGRKWESLKFKNYKGQVKDKIACLKKYKFYVCYENTRNIKGYVTEKIFHCLIAGCVPIYWGADNITDFVPADCFIDRRNFNSFEEVYEYIKNMSRDEYEIYIENIRRYLKSDLAYKYSSDYFVHNVLAVLSLKKLT